MGRRLGGVSHSTSVAFDPTELGERIRGWRREHGWSALRLAEAIGVDRSYLSRLERGEIRQPATSILEGLQAALGLSTMEELLRMGVRDNDGEVLPDWDTEDPSFLHAIPSFRRVNDLAHFSRHAHQQGRLFQALELARNGYVMLLGLGSNDPQFYEADLELLYRLAEVSHDLRHSQAALQYITTLVSRPTFSMLHQAKSAKIVSYPDDHDSGNRSSTVENSIDNEAHILRAKATIHVVLGQWSEAEEQYQKALKVANEALEVAEAKQVAELKHLKGRILNSYCWFRIRQGDFAEAQYLCEESLRLKEEAKARARSKAYNYNHRAEILLAYIALGWTDPSPDAFYRLKKDLHDAAEGFSVYQDWRNLAEVHLVQATAELCMGDPNSALTAARKALDYGIDKSTQSFLYQVKAHRILGEIHLETGDLREAERHLTESLKLTSHIQDDYEIASTKRVIGELLLAKSQNHSQSRRDQQYQKARKYLEEALVTFQTLRGLSAHHKPIEELKTEKSLEKWKEAGVASGEHAVA